MRLIKPAVFSIGGRSRDLTLPELALARKSD